MMAQVIQTQEQTSDVWGTDDNPTRPWWPLGAACVTNQRCVCQSRWVEFTKRNTAYARLDRAAGAVGRCPVHRGRCSRVRLAWVQQNHMRADTMARANARLVDAQRQLPLAQVWSGGDVASADGLRFVVPIRTLNAGPNSKYFWAERG